MQTHDSPAPPLSHSPAIHLGRLLIVDDEAELMTALCEALSKQGYDTAGFASCGEALEALKGQDFDLVLTDLMMPEMDGIALLKAGLNIDPHLVGIVMTGQGTIQTAVEAMKVGAFDYILKPFKLNTLLPLVSRALGVRRLRMENVQLHETVAIYDLSKAIAFTLDLNTLLNKVADAALQQCEADEVSIMLPTREGDELYVAALSGEQRGYILGERVPIEQGIAGYVAQHREPLTLHGEVRDPRFAPVRPREDIHSAVSMPMMVGGKLVGVLNVNATRPRRPFTLGQVKALQILTSTAASALESSWLFSRVQEAEEKYRSIFENTVEGIFQTTPDGQFLTANPAAAHMLGYDSPEEIIAEVTDIAHQLYVDPELRSEFRRLLEEHGVVEGFEYQVRRKDGGIAWVSENVRAVRDACGKLLFYEGTCENITERKQAEEALKASREHVRDLIDSSLDMIIAVDNDRKIVEFNRAAEATFGYRPEEVLGKHVDLLYADPEEGLKVHNTTVVNGKCLQEVLNRRKNGEVFPSFLSASILRSARGEQVGIMGISRDITERMQAEERLREIERRVQQQDRLAAVGQLAAGIAHDFNNMLSSVMGFAQLLEMRDDIPDAARKDLRTIFTQGQRAAQLIRQVLDFSRKTVAERQPVDLAPFLKETIKLLKRTLSENIRIIPNFGPGAHSVDANLTQLQQVITNLAINARDAMPGGGELRVGLSLLSIKAGDRPPVPELDPGDWVVWAVSDAGCGMPPEVLAHIFEPFFTTKGPGEGTGLGLAQVYGIVKQHSGFIDVESEVGRGTTFTIYLPEAAKARAPDERQGIPFQKGRGETVLVVEDDAAVRRTAGAILEHLNYRVLLANDGREALEICHRHADEIALVLTDIVMPEMGGLELIDALLERAPGVPVVVMTGYPPEQEIRARLPQGLAGWLQKPLSLEQVGQVVSEGLKKGRRP